ncbi:MAG: dockerin type I repeat-containing protein [Oscillospiraceae bacterium]|nr:dockerin type I repeat-containing protein [Oscillospiraceae bacterium]
MKKNTKRILSTALALAMAAQSVPMMNFPKAEAASNINGTFEGQDADIFSALGFDTSEIPEGYDADTVDNPYGRDKLTGNQVFEILVSDANGTKSFGKNNNNLSATDISGTPNAAGHGLVMSAVASGDFDGDGLAGEVAYVGYTEIQYNTWRDKSNLYLCVYDAKTNTFSDLKQIGTFNPAQVTTKGGTVYSRYDYAWQNLLQITAGDYDGDGIAEIAAYVADDGNCRVDIFKFQKTSQSTDTSWLDISQWSRTWSHVISNTANQIPNMVSLVSADINRDGIDDLGISSGRFSPGNSEGTLQETDKSSAVILLGDRNDMLQKSYALNLDEANLGEQVRVSLTTGDLDNDGYAELIATGQPLSDADDYLFSTNYTANTNSTVGNRERTIITYTYDSELGLVINYSGVHKTIDGDYVTETVDDTETTTWRSTNGFDDIYYSQPVMRTNAAAFNSQGSDYTYLYLDSCMYEYTEGQMTLMVSLDDASYDGQNSLNAYWGADAGNSFANALLSSVYGYEQENYVEYGASSADINGDGYDTLVTGYMFANSRKYPDDEGVLISQQAAGYMSLGSSSEGTLISANTLTANTGIIIYNTTDEAYELGSDSDYASVAMVDIDTDTVIIEYTGVHYLTYSDPEVLAILAAAPYFEDVDRVSNYDYAWQNTTSYGKTVGEGDGDIVAVDLEVGGYVSNEHEFASVKTEIETSINYTMEWEKVTTNTTEYTLSFETSQNEDAVAFFSIPTENYVYKILTPDGNGGYNETYDTISNTFTPCYQILTLDYYESIQSNYEVLPEIAGTAITSTPGDPSSYPTSTSGYNVIAQWNDDPAGVSFGNGAITQEITVTEEVEESYNMGAAWDFQFGIGIGTQSDLGQMEFDTTGGIQFSLNPTGGWSNIDITGTTFTGTVTNMPLQFQDYGYYYNWKLFAYQYSFDNGASIPVVSYVVGDVTEPPQLPDDFQQDYDRTTSSTNVLTWTYDSAFSSFLIHKYYDFPVGGGLQEILEIPIGCDPRTEVSNSTGTYAYGYNLKYDEHGKQYKEYYFEDCNLAPYTEYDYAIQVERLAKTPPLSSPSELVTVRTKASIGNPLIPISESDGTNDGKLQIYPDKNSYLTVNTTGPDGENPADYYTTVQYQWQKIENGAWTNMIGETDKTLTFANAGVDTTGEYRCLVNVLTQSDATAISAYTESISLNHSKRVSYIDETEISVQDVPGGGVYFYAQVRNAHGDSASIPSGTVNFTLRHNATGKDYQVTTKLNDRGIAEMTVDYTLPEGLYTVSAYYSGSYIFKSCVAETLFLSQRSYGLAVDTVDSVSYGEGAQVVSRIVTNINGVTYSEEETADSFYIKPATATATRAYGSFTSIEDGQSVTKGQKYVFNDDGINRYFTAEYSSTVHFLNGYALYDIDDSYISYTGDGGKYRISENTPAGNYLVVMSLTKELETLTSHAFITINKCQITVQLPYLKISEGVVPPSSYSANQWNIVSGKWAECDMENGTLKSDIASHTINVSYKNSAGTILSASDVSKLCGAYTSHGRFSNSTSNYSVKIIDGSVAVLGGTHNVELGVRSFEGKDVGTLYAIAPDYASTRNTADSSDALIQKHATGTRLVFTAVPDEGYAIYAWYINGIKQSTTSSTIAYTMLNEETTIEVQFDVKKNGLTFGAAGDENGGTITCSDENLTSGSIVIPNAYMTFTAKANEGYHFKEWRYTESGSGTSYDDTDSGLTESTFTLLMPAVSCSLYAVFERDYYTFEYIDESGSNGLTAWYSEYQPGAVVAETVYVESGAQVKGDTVITVEPKAGYLWNQDYNYVSSGSQGVADYDNGTYTFTLSEDSTVYGNTIQDEYDVTLEFAVTELSEQPCDAEIIYYIDDEISGTFVYDPENTTYTIEDVPGGSKVSAEVYYPSYYLHDGWASKASTVITPTTEKNNLAQQITSDGAVENGKAYWYTGINAQGVSTIYYFISPATGTAVCTSAGVTVFSSNTAFTIEELDCDDTLTVFLTEKDVHKVTTADIGDKGTYSFTLPEGSYRIDSEIYIHDGDDFDVLITPNTGWTVTYWNIKPTSSPEQEVKASSLRYIIPDVTEDFVLTPIFASTSYNIISWPTISEDQNFLTLSEYNSVSSVATGSSFSFKLSGSGLSLLESVHANNATFVPEENGGNYTYADVDGDRIYTIKNITANHTITVSFNKVGVTVNGTDISALKGTGWYYDATSQVLVIEKSNMTLSGTNDNNIAPNLSILLKAESLTLQNIILDSDASGTALINAEGNDTVITLMGTNNLSHNGSVLAGIAAIDGNLTLRGNGTLNLGGECAADCEIITYNDLTITGKCTVNAIGCNGYASLALIYAENLSVKGTSSLNVESDYSCNNAVNVDTFTVGSSDQSDSPSVHIDGSYYGIYVYDQLTIYCGDFAVSGVIYALRTYGSIANHGGTMELCVTNANGSIIRGYSYYTKNWDIYYPYGYLVNYIDSYGEPKSEAPRMKSDYSNNSFDRFAGTRIFGSKWKSDVCSEDDISDFRQIRIIPLSTENDLTLSVTVDGAVYSSAIDMDSTDKYGYYYIDSENNSLAFLQTDRYTNISVDTFAEDPEYVFVAKLDTQTGITLGKYSYQYDDGSLNNTDEDTSQEDTSAEDEDSSEESLTPAASYKLVEFMPDSSSKYDYTISGSYIGSKTISAANDYVSKLTLDNVTLTSLNVSEVPVWLSGDNTIAGTLDLDINDSDEVYDLELHSEDGNGTLLVSDCFYPINAENEALKFALYNIKRLELIGNNGILAQNQDIDITYTDSNGNQLPYGLGWQINMSANRASAAVQPDAHLTTGGNGYIQVTRLSSDALLNPATIEFDKSNGTDGVLGLEDAVIEVTEPIEDGTLRNFSKEAESAEEATGYVVLIDADGNQKVLASGTDYIWTESTNLSEANTLTLTSGSLSALELGSYTIRIFYYDDDIGDTDFYYSDAMLSITDATRISGSITVSPIEPKIGRGESVDFTTDFIGTEPMAYEWILSGNTSAETTITTDDGVATLTIAENEEIGSNITITVKSYADEGMTKEIGFVIASVNVIAKAENIEISCDGESPSGDGSYTLHHTNDEGILKTWTFRGKVLLDNGDTSSDNISWSLWGNKLRATTIDSATGKLTVSPNETGTNGIMKLTATFMNEDGSTFSKTIDIHLSSDVWVGVDNSDTTKGTLTLKVDSTEISDGYLPIGTTVTVKADANEGYDLKNWYVNGESVAENPEYTIDNSRNTLTFITQDGGYYAISAEFYSIGKVSVTYETNGLGNVTAASGDEPLSSNDEVLENSSVTFTAIPNAFCSVKAWYVNDVLQAGTENTLTLDDLTEDVNIRVEFEASERVITINSSQGGYVTATLNGEIVSGDVITITSIDTLILQPTVNDGYSFTGWDGDVTSTRGDACVIMPGIGDVTVTPIFTTIPNHTVTIYTNSYQNGGGSVICGALNIPMSSSDSVTVIDGKALVLTALSDTGSYLYSWTVEGAEYVEDGNTLTLENITSDVTVIAKFRRTDTYQITYPTTVDNGSVSAIYSLTVGSETLEGELSGNDAVKAGADVIFTLSPAEGYIPTVLTANGTSIEFSYDEAAMAYVGVLKTVMEDTTIDVSFDTYNTHTVIVRNEFTEMVEVPSEDTETGDGTDTGDGTEEPEYEEKAMGQMSISYVADGASTMDANAAEGTSAVIMAHSGTAIITLKSAAGYEVNVYTLREQVTKILNQAGSDADAAYTVSDEFVQVTLTGIDTSLDFTEMLSPFAATHEEAELYHTVTILQPEGGRVNVTWNSAIVEDGAKVPYGSVLIISGAADDHYKLESLTSNDVANTGSTTVIDDVTISAVFSSQHTYQAVAVVEPTCTTQGYTTYSCECGDTYIDDFTDLLPHSFTNYISDGNATAYSNGTKTAKCDHCDATDTIIDEVAVIYSDAGKTEITVDCVVGYSNEESNYDLDVSEHIIITANQSNENGSFDASLDIELTETGNAQISPYDLYWNAYNAENATHYFSVQYMFDMAEIDSMFASLSETIGAKLTYESNFDLLEGILYDKNGNGLAVAQYIYKVAQRGDANLDHSNDAKDAALVAKYSGQLASLPAGAQEPVLSETDNTLSLQAADANLDGTIDAKDAALIAKYSALFSTYSQDMSDAEKYYQIWSEIG